MNTVDISPEAITSITELYRLLSLAKARKGTEYVDFIALEDRPRTEEEAVSMAAAETAEFSRILESRNEVPEFDAWLKLGCDLILNKFRA